MIGLVALIVAVVILVFFGIGYLFGTRIPVTILEGGDEDWVLDGVLRERTYLGAHYTRPPNAALRDLRNHATARSILLSSW